MFAERKLVTVTTDDQGDGIGYVSVPQGKVMSIHYTKVDFATGVDFAITAEETGETIWTENDVNASASKYPRVAVHTTAGAAALFADSGTNLVEPIVLANDQIKFVISDGGDTKTGQFMVVLA